MVRTSSPSTKGRWHRLNSKNTRGPWQIWQGIHQFTLMYKNVVYFIQSIERKAKSIEMTGKVLVVCLREIFPEQEAWGWGQPMDSSFDSIGLWKLAMDAWQQLALGMAKERLRVHHLRSWHVMFQVIEVSVSFWRFNYNECLMGNKRHLESNYFWLS